MTIDPRPTVADPDDDPYLWLEDIDGEAAQAWVAAQNEKTLATFADARFAADRDTLATILDRPDNIPYIARRGAYVYNFWKDAEHPRGLWRRTTLADFGSQETSLEMSHETSWEILLDLDALAAAEKEDWVWGGATTLPGSHDRAILRLSRGGGDAVVLREFDVTGLCFVADGFVLPEAKGGVDWVDRDTLLLASAHGEGMATKSGYSRTVRLWRRGAPPDAAEIIFETTAESMGTWSGIDRCGASPRIWLADKPAFFEVMVWLGEHEGAKTRLDLPTDIEVQLHADWLVVQRHSAWDVSGQVHAADTLLAISLTAFLADSRDFTVLFTPQPRRALQGFSWCGEALVLSILDDLNPLFELLTPSDGDWPRRTLPGFPKTSVAAVWPLDVEDSESNGDLLASLQDPLTPPRLTLIEAAAAGSLEAPRVLKQAPEAFDATGLQVTRHEARSSDGTGVPYVQVGPPGETGDAPVYMTGYGGFRVTNAPGYRAAIGKLWLERGGSFVIANIRGGGEFGSAWHEAGRHAGKALSHDDFAAVAADLVARGVTHPRRIAAEGGSNGGILISNMLTRYPDRFGALFCTIPLIDMRRYTKLLAGASWIDEYGDPDKPADWAYLQGYSAYHQAVPGKSYPPILLATSGKDDRVHPGHARKMAAKLQVLGYEAYFYEPASGGHGYGKDNRETAGFVALGQRFLSRKIGWDSGAD